MAKKEMKYDEKTKYEKALRELFEEKELATNIHLHWGDFKDSNNPPYIIFKPQAQAVSKFKRKLETLLESKITEFNPEISRVYYNYFEGGAYRMNFELNPVAEVHDDLALKRRVFGTIATVLRNYS